MFSISLAAYSGKGKVREHNEDNICINERTLTPGEVANGFAASSELNAPFVLSVFDGMGGEAAGECASAAAAAELARRCGKIKISGERFPAEIVSCYLTANERICALASNTSGRTGSTAATVYGFADNIIVANIGDSRVYLCAEGIIKKLSVDHTEMQMKINTGIISEAAAEDNPGNHRLTQHLGISPEEMKIEPSVGRPVPVREDDCILLCSDGLTDKLNQATIAAILGAAPNAQAAVNTLVNEAMSRGGNDNITVIVAKVIKRHLGAISNTNTQKSAAPPVASAPAVLPQGRAAQRNVRGANAAAATAAAGQGGILRPSAPVAPVGGAQPRHDRGAKKPDMKKIGIIIAAAVLVICIAVIIAIAIGKKDNGVIDDGSPTSPWEYIFGKADPDETKPTAQGGEETEAPGGGDNQRRTTTRRNAGNNNNPTTPPATNPPATNPPATNPPVTNPPVTSPPVTSPPATQRPLDPAGGAGDGDTGNDDM